MSESNNNFEDLKQLLKLKRHEIPPPGHFNHFSGDVIARIRAGESGGGQHFVERLHSRWPTLANLLQIFEARPGIIGGLATSVCLLLVFAVILADRPESGSMGPEAMVAQPMADASPTLASTVSLAPADNSSGISMSTNPVSSLQPGASLFGAQQNPLFQPAAFMPAAH
jgi:hypothetical protein